MYKLDKIPYAKTDTTSVIRLSDNAFIPFDPANTDYVAYLKWLEEGNVPLPADEPPADEPPADEPPADEPPVDEPPADEVVE
jgi:hypothetical protein